MNGKKLRLLTLSAILTALTCVSTLIIRIPTPTKGYVNLGDAFVNMNAWLLGPVYGSVASGIGSALADLLAGYPVYCAATLVIKGLMAVVSYAVFKAVSAKEHGLRGRIAGAVSAEIVMILGYFLFEGFLYGSFAAGALGIGANAAQGVMGAVGSVLVYEAVLKRIPRSTT